MGKALIHLPLLTSTYPADWTKTVEVKLDGMDRRWTLRYVRVGDEAKLPRYFSFFTPEELRLRFFYAPPLEKLCPVRARALYEEAFGDRWSRVMVLVDEAGELEGVARATEGNKRGIGTGVFEVSFSTRLKGKGVGKLLLRELMCWADSSSEVRMLEAVTLRENTPMNAVFERFGFVSQADPHDPAVIIWLRAVLHRARA